MARFLGVGCGTTLAKGSSEPLEAIMSGSISSTQSATPVAHHHHHKPAAATSSQTDPLSASTTGASTSSASTASASQAAPAGAGLQKFASELQSILLNAQSGQSSGTATTASASATSTNPLGATGLFNAGQILLYARM
jgi:hypothetical protein